MVVSGYPEPRRTAVQQSFHNLTALVDARRTDMWAERQHDRLAEQAQSRTPAAGRQRWFGPVGTALIQVGTWLSGPPAPEPVRVAVDRAERAA